MAEYVCYFNKDNTIIIKAPKKSALFLRMIVLLFSMLCCVYICIICINQITSVTKISYERIQVNMNISQQLDDNISQQLDDNISQQLDDPLLHYPKPQSFNRSECAGNPVRFFAILSMQRSGSGWFETLLNSHVNVSSNGEIFTGINRRKNISSIIETLDKVYDLDLFTSASKNECSAAVGFKWMMNQGLMEHHEEIVKYFNRRGISAVFLFRRNLLRRMVSMLANSYDRYAKLLNGTHKSHVHSTEEADRLSRYKPEINSTSLIHDLKVVEMTAKKASEYFNTTRHIILYYEDLIKNHTKLKDVQQFLSIPQMDLTSRQVKIHKGSLSDHIKNWDDVNKILNGTEYEQFLQADY